MPSSNKIVKSIIQVSNKNVSTKTISSSFLVEKSQDCLYRNKTTYRSQSTFKFNKRLMKDTIMNSKEQIYSKTNQKNTLNEVFRMYTTSNNDTSKEKTENSENKITDQSQDEINQENNQKSEQLSKREQILAQLRNERLLSPETKIESDRLKKKLNFEDKHLRAMSIFNQEIDTPEKLHKELNNTENKDSENPQNIEITNEQSTNYDNSQQKISTENNNYTEDTGAYSNQNENGAEDPYAYVKSLPEAKYVSTKDGTHFWESTFVFLDDEGDHSKIIRLNLKEAASLKEKYMVEDLNLALNMFMNGEPTHPNGIHIPYNEERKMKNQFSDQVFEVVPQTTWEKFKSLNFRVSIAKFLKHLLFLFVIWTITKALFKSLDNQILIAEKFKKESEKREEKNQLDRERAIARRIAEGKPVYDKDGNEIVIEK